MLPLGSVNSRHLLFKNKTDVENVHKVFTKFLSPKGKTVTAIRDTESDNNQSIAISEKSKTILQTPQPQATTNILFLSPDQLSNPNIAQQNSRSIPFTSISDAIFSGKNKEAVHYINVKLSKGQKLTKDEEWLVKAFDNDMEDIKNEDLIVLDPKLQKHLFRIANIYSHQDLVVRLNDLGMNGRNINVQGPNIISPKMDVIQTRAALMNHLVELRKEKVLLKKNEFSTHFTGVKFIRKGLDCSRILGRRFIEDAIKKVGLQRIKIPKKYAVIENNAETISIKIGNTYPLEITSNDISIYAERLEKEDRKMTRDEAEELVYLLEKTSYEDIRIENFILTKDGVSIINTQLDGFKVFPYPQYEKMRQISNMLDENDQIWFKELIERKIEVFHQSKNEYDAEQKVLRAQAEKDLKNMGFRDRQTHFIFNVRAII